MQVSWNWIIMSLVAINIANDFELEKVNRCKPFCLTKILQHWLMNDERKLISQVISTKYIKRCHASRGCGFEVWESSSGTAGHSQFLHVFQVGDQDPYGLPLRRNGYPTGASHIAQLRPALSTQKDNPPFRVFRAFGLARPILSLYQLAQDIICRTRMMRHPGTHHDVLSIACQMVAMEPEATMRRPCFQADDDMPRMCSYWASEASAEIAIGDNRCCLQALLQVRESKQWGQWLAVRSQRDRGCHRCIWRRWRIWSVMMLLHKKNMERVWLMTSYDFL